ncbi:ferric reduction oxidase 2 [Striga asiatica]|uniref:Ferric reduction oxidase 2 n=1 Tax=Striga asiatica TaxID=4170 RepID=A0A5A7QN08_STRAF|nr:ferric reduction oxidase 2 [Striga asiatica]
MMRTPSEVNMCMCNVLKTRVALAKTKNQLPSQESMIYGKLVLSVSITKLPQAWALIENFHFDLQNMLQLFEPICLQHSLIRLVLRWPKVASHCLSHELEGLTTAAGTELADAYSLDTVIASSRRKEVHDPWALLNKSEVNLLRIEYFLPEDLYEPTAAPTNSLRQLDTKVQIESGGESKPKFEEPTATRKWSVPASTRRLASRCNLPAMAIELKRNSLVEGHENSPSLSPSVKVSSHAPASLGKRDPPVERHKNEPGSETRSSKRNTKVNFLKKPMIVKGLGIVTINELVLFILFVALCVWYFAYYVRHWFKQVPMLSMTRHEKTWQTKLDRVAIVTGVTGNLCLTFLFYPVTRKSSILPMIGLTSEASIKYHIWLGHMTMALFTAHGFLYIVYWALTNRISEMIKWNDHYVSNIAGEISLLCGLTLWVTTYPNIRRKMFELFFYTHHLYIGFIIFFILHAGIGFACIMLPGFYLFVIDRYLRFLQSRQNVRLVSARVLPCETVELNFAKYRGLTYSPTSTMFINLPIISKLQWHPFTITSNSSLEPERLSIVVKCEGSWTKKLYDSVSSPSSVSRLQVSVEGPYGPDTTNFLRHDMLVMISGGSGITPFISIITELMFITSTIQNCKIPKLMLISVFKNTSHLSMLDLIPPISHTNSCNLALQIEAYVTREKAQPTEKPQSIRTVQFRPSPSDAPIFPVLGPNSWLWLSTIISSSFVIFLVLLGTFTQYVVYPIDKNTNLLYSYTKKNSMNIFLICVSIVATASSVFVWNKNRNAKEDKQIQDMERIGNTFGSSDDDVELQSLPLQSVIKSINVHYGKRPDLKRILMENKESNSNVGVLVSGPWKMRKDVAGICSNGPDNIHFESISFSW